MATQFEKSNNLIFLESSTKRSTIKSFLGSDYTVFATGGHLLTLEKSGDYNLGVDLKNFSPRYEIIGNKSKLVSFWRDFLLKNPKISIFIATDPDREGEGIAREIIDLLELKSGSYKRLFFHEITYGAIKESLENPLEVKKELIEAQMSREVLDRMIGFCLSSLLQKKINAWSAGRVQSVVLKLIVDREKEITDYSSKKQYLISASFKHKRKNYKLFQLEENDSVSLKNFKSEEEAQKEISEIGTNFEFSKDEKIKSYIFPKLPLTTSLLLYESRVKLGYSIQKTTSIAQKLYEGIVLKGDSKKRISLITYPRTDSSRVSKFFVFKVSSFIKEKWGDESFRFPNFKYSSDNKKNVQNAHEAIRPTYLNQSPEKLVNEIEEKEVFNLYELIYNHTVASFMNPVEYSNDKYFFITNKKSFVANEKIIISKGFLSALGEDYLSRYNLIYSSIFNDLKSLEIKKENISIEEDIDKAPRRYTEGSLIKKLELLGIGRPSTYNSFSTIILKRRYASLEKKTYFVPTELGFKVNSWLQGNFSSLINENYTATLEEELDKISNGHLSYIEFISKFWKNFFESYKVAEKDF